MSALDVLLGRYSSYDDEQTVTIDLARGAPGLPRGTREAIVQSALRALRRERAGAR